MYTTEKSRGSTFRCGKHQMVLSSWVRLGGVHDNLSLNGLCF